MEPCYKLVPYAISNETKQQLLELALSPDAFVDISYKISFFKLPSKLQKFNTTGLNCACQMLMVKEPDSVIHKDKNMNPQSTSTLEQKFKSYDTIVFNTAINSFNTSIMKFGFSNVIGDIKHTINELTYYDSHKTTIQQPHGGKRKTRKNRKHLIKKTSKKRISRKVKKTKKTKKQKKQKKQKRIKKYKI